MKLIDMVSKSQYFTYHGPRHHEQEKTYIGLPSQAQLILKWHWTITLPSTSHHHQTHFSAGDITQG
jgi:hypothetical protein